MCDTIPGEFTYNVDGRRLSDSEYIDLRDQSYANPKNICLLNKLIPLFPQNNSIFFEADIHSKNVPGFEKYQKTIKENNMTLISVDLAINYEKYKKYFDKKDFSIFRVSEKDAHPSGFANQMYSDILFEEITNKPEWNFNSN
jgi:hypothetical protein